MEYTQAQLTSLLISLGEEGTPPLAQYPGNSGNSNVDDTVLMGYPRKGKDGVEQLELSIGVILHDHVSVVFPLIDILKYALRHQPDIVIRAQEEWVSEMPERP